MLLPCLKGSNFHWDMELCLQENKNHETTRFYEKHRHKLESKLKSSIKSHNEIVRNDALVMWYKESMSNFAETFSSMVQIKYFCDKTNNYCFYMP